MFDMDASDQEGKGTVVLEGEAYADERMGEEVRDGGVQSQEASGSITSAGLLAKLEQQQYRCALTGRKLTPATAALDHIEPKSVGNNDTIDNVHWVHGDVNKAKGTMELGAFIAMCKEIAAWTERTGQA